jgi:hypothetical protein
MVPLAILNIIGPFNRQVGFEFRRSEPQTEADIAQRSGDHLRLQ